MEKFKIYTLRNIDEIVCALETNPNFFEPEDLVSFIKYDYNNYKYLGKSNEELFDLYYESKSDNIKETIIISNIKLINWCIRVIFSTIDSSLELQLVGLEGLVKAVNTFDKNISTNFSRYAILCIFSSIKTSFKDIVNITYDDYVCDKKITHYKDEIYKDKETKYIFDELADIADIDVPEEKIKKLENIYLCESLDSDEYEYLIEETIDEDYDIDLEVDLRLLRGDLSKKLSILTPRQRESLLYEYGFYPEINSREEIAKLFNVSRETIRKDAKEALRILRAEENIYGINYNKSNTYDDKVYRRIYELYKYNLDYDDINTILVNEYPIKKRMDSIRRKVTKTIHRFMTILDLCKNTNYTSRGIILLIYDKWKENISLDFVETLIRENREYNIKK